MNGTMTQQWTVWCGTCSSFDQVSGSKGQATKEFKRGGWKKINGKWMCPTCFKNNPTPYYVPEDSTPY